MIILTKENICWKPRYVLMLHLILHRKIVGDISLLYQQVG